jgi:Zn-finger nucleic acid-binding protein
VFLDEGELERIQATVEKDHRTALEQPQDTVTEGIQARLNEEMGPIQCPKCGTLMDSHRYGMGSQTVVDSCLGCGGMWLDGGELEALEQFYERAQEETDMPLTFRMWVMWKSSRKGKPKA